MSEREDLKQARDAIVTLVARVEALEGALREIEALRDANPGEWMNAAYTIARAALAGSEPPTTCPDCHSPHRECVPAFIGPDYRTYCPDPWHTVPTGTEPPPFNPDPDLIYDRGSGKKPSADEVRGDG